MSDSVTSRPNRRKGSEARTWVVVGAEGEREEVEAGRQMIMRRTGLAPRDMRILAPLLSHDPATVVGRERAIVINLEHIKAIITAHEVLLLNSRDPSVVPFVDHLHDRILHHHQPTHPLREGKSVDSSRKEAHDLEEPMQFHDQDDEQVKAKRKQNGVKILPFEFVALEACLEAACSALENEAKILNQEAHAALDELTSHISTLNLERVRQIKSRLVAITGRVQKVKDELENLLDDDEDMSEMYLTKKLVQQNDGDDTENQVLQPDINDRTTPEISLELSGDSSARDEDHQNAADDYSRDQTFGASNNGVGGCNHQTYAGTAYGAVTKKPDVQMLEMLVEAYLVQIGGTLNKLFTLSEYVDDTEDYINVMLDDKQNKLLQMEILVNTASVILEAFVAVAGIFAINIQIWQFTKDGMELRMILGGTAGCILLYAVAIAWYKRKGLLN